MDAGSLGKRYADGEIIIREGEIGDRMFFIRSGNAKVSRLIEGNEVHIADLKEGDIFGEMAIFEQERRSATVTASGEALILSIDKTGFLRRIHEDPSLVFRVLQQMSERIRKLDTELATIKSSL